MGLRGILAGAMMLVSAGQALAGDISVSGPGSQAYMKYHEVMLKCKSPEEIWPYLAENRVKQMQADKAKMPAQEFSFMFGMIKEMTPPKVRVLSEAMKDKTCVLTLDAPNFEDPMFKGLKEKLDVKSKDTTTGKVTLVEEKGVWKIEKEQWSSKSVSADDNASTVPGGGDSSGAVDNSVTVSGGSAVPASTDNAAISGGESK